MNKQEILKDVVIREIRTVLLNKGMLPTYMNIENVEIFLTQYKTYYNDRYNSFKIVFWHNCR